MTERVDLPFRPYHCVWELTLACNLSCAHCGSAAGRCRDDELSTDECLQVVDQLAALDCQLITLSGGEPTLRKDWPRIVDTARRRGILVNLVTNGTTITAKLAHLMATSGLANVAVSLDGTRASHDAVRGAGTFDRAAAGLQRLVEAGVSTAVLTHLNRLTVAELEETHEAACQLGASAWRLQLGKPMGRLSRKDKLLARPSDVLHSLSQLACLRRESRIDVMVGDSLGHFGSAEQSLGRRSWDGTAAPWRGCQAGRQAIGLESDGGVKACLSLQAGSSSTGRDPFREGNLRERPLEAIWFDKKTFAWNRSPRPELAGSCRSCRYASLCRGGPKCVAAAFTGRLGENPYCAYRLERQLQRRSEAGLWRQAAAALLALGVGSAALSGCDNRPVSSIDLRRTGDGTIQKSDGRTSDGRADGARSDAGKQDSAKSDAGDPCASVCCLCDYGIIPPDKWKLCCQK